MQFQDAVEVETLAELPLLGDVVSVKSDGTGATLQEDELGDKQGSIRCKYVHEQKDTDGATAWRLSKLSRRKFGLEDPQAVFRVGEGDKTQFWSV